MNNKPIIHIVTPSIGRHNLLALYGLLKPFLDQNLITWTIAYDKHLPIKHNNIIQLYLSDHVLTKVKTLYNYVRNKFSYGYFYVLDDDDLVDRIYLSYTIKELSTIQFKKTVVIMPNQVYDLLLMKTYIESFDRLFSRKCMKFKEFIARSLRCLETFSNLLFGNILFSIDINVDISRIDSFIDLSAIYTTDVNFMVYSDANYCCYLSCPFYIKVLSNHSLFTLKNEFMKSLKLHRKALIEKKRMLNGQKNYRYIL